MEKEDGSKFSKGETAKFKVIEFNKDYRRIVVSHTAVYKAQERRNMKAAANKASDAEKTTLGDIGGLADLKKKMEADSKNVKSKFVKSKFFQYSNIKFRIDPYDANSSFHLLLQSILGFLMCLGRCFERHTYLSSLAID